MCGKPRSGKSLILEQLLEQHFADKLDEIFYIDCYQMHSKKKLDDEFSKISSLTVCYFFASYVFLLLLKPLMKESASALVINFEQLAQRSQNFLYQVLDLSRRGHCFVLLLAIKRSISGTYPLSVRRFSRRRKTKGGTLGNRNFFVEGSSAFLIPYLLYW